MSFVLLGGYRNSGYPVPLYLATYTIDLAGLCHSYMAPTGKSDLRAVMSQASSSSHRNPFLKNFTFESGFGYDAASTHWEKDLNFTALLWKLVRPAGPAPSTVYYNVMSLGMMVADSARRRLVQASNGCALHV